MKATAPISAAIPTFRRPSQLAVALERILACDPAPDEIVVHVDAGDDETANRLAERFPGVRVLGSAERQGPGGGRNRLVQQARNDIIASFDDDSYPLDREYFARLQAIFEARPDACVVASHIVHRGESAPPAEASVERTAHFVGCGVAYRRADFLAAGGYVPLAVAYGMEEVDLAIRLFARNRPLYHSRWLRVFHDTDLAHHANAAITAASLSNQALLVYLRYPASYWAYGIAQVANRLAWLVRAGRFTGIIRGLSGIPAHLCRYRRHRAVVSAEALASYLRMRNAPSQAEPLLGANANG